MPATGNKTYSTQSLSIRVCADGFSFFVCDSQATNLIRGQHYHVEEGQPLAEKLRNELGTPNYFNRDIDQVYVVICGPSTRIPLEEFRRDEAASLYELTFGNVDLHKLHVAYNILPQLEVAELFAIPADVEEAILQFYPTARFFGHRAMLLERLLRYVESVPITQPASRLFLFQDDDAHFTLVSFDRGHLRFVNTFPLETPTDAVYYILAVWRHLKMDAQTDELTILAGRQGENDPLRTQLMQFLLHVNNLTCAELFPSVALAAEKEIPLDLMSLLLNRI